MIGYVTVGTNDLPRATAFYDTLFEVIGAQRLWESDALHSKALALGAKDEGAAGPRGDGSFYCGYFRDLDGNKFNAFCMPSAAA
jgi:predicted lactoylglutathione lyase